MTIEIIIAGATGQVGRELVPATLAAEHMELAGVVSRTAAGRDIGEVLGGAPVGIEVSRSLADALGNGADVLIDYTHPSVILDHIAEAFQVGVHVVIGTTGLNEAEHDEIDRMARANGLGAVSGNFSLTPSIRAEIPLIGVRSLISSVYSSTR